VEGLIDLAVAEAASSWRDRLPSLLDGVAPATN